jgi:hypothetical protein
MIFLFTLSPDGRYGGFLHGGKAGLEADHSFPSNAEIRNS